jgi:hypothetical protein
MAPGKHTRKKRMMHLSEFLDENEQSARSSPVESIITSPPEPSAVEDAPSEVWSSPKADLLPVPSIDACTTSVTHTEEAKRACCEPLHEQTKTTDLVPVEISHVDITDEWHLL